MELEFVRLLEIIAFLTNLWAPKESDFWSMIVHTKLLSLLELPQYEELAKQDAFGCCALFALSFVMGKAYRLKDVRHCSEDVTVNRRTSMLKLDQVQ